MSHSNVDQILCSNCRSKIHGLASESGIDESDYQKLLQRTRLNCIPSVSQDRAQMQVQINEAVRDLERYDCAISELEAELDRLKKLRNDIVKKRIDLRVSLLSPIRKLPSEILTEVFDYVRGPIILTAENSLTASGVMKRCGKLLSPDFTLTWICSLWRTLVISRSQIWSSFQIVCHDDFPIATPEIVNFVRECFQVRAGTALRTITICGTDYTRNQELAAPVLDVLLETTQYWKKMSCDLRSDEFAIMEYLNDKPREFDISRWPLLESLYLFFHCLDGRSVSDSERIYGSFRLCPQLHHLELWHLENTDRIDLFYLTFLKIESYGTACTMSFFG
ncbi:hypothetical protein GYMLUDRAFT_412148 [Collybiopsis luxurians FD-317 M1]|nr:hypothetical protein GYMLUDRAFT_412148 [Collybiopsis luxurians FD-317 M1]